MFSLDILSTSVCDCSVTGVHRVLSSNQVGRGLLRKGEVAAVKHVYCNHLTYRGPTGCIHLRKDELIYFITKLLKMQV
jgi:hypothetical protein